MTGLAESGCRRTARQPEQPKSSSSDALDVDDDSMTILGQQPPTWSTPSSTQQEIRNSGRDDGAEVVRGSVHPRSSIATWRRGNDNENKGDEGTSAEVHLCRGAPLPRRRSAPEDAMRTSPGSIKRGVGISRGTALRVSPLFLLNFG